jgi:hypothetical protein
MTPIKYYWEDFTPGWQYESQPKMLTSRVLNQKNEVVCSMTGRQHYRRRTPATNSE